LVGGLDFGKPAWERVWLERKRKRDTKWPLARVALLVVAVLATSATAARAIEPYSMKPVELRASVVLPQSLAAAVDQHGVHVFTYLNGLESPICDIFWAKSVAAQDGTSRSSNVLYGALTPGALVGIIRFLEESREDYREDFHDQKLAPGYYTMRYAVLRDGESSDFVVLTPVSADRDPERVVASDELVRVSHTASGTEQPAVMKLVAIDKTAKEFPDVIMADDGSCILHVKLQLKPEKGGSARELPLAIIVATPIEENGGS
jgi:hypothetical protein